MKVHLERLTISELATLMDAKNISSVIPVLDKAVDGGVSDLSVSQLGQVLTALHAALTELSDDVKIAVYSYRRHERGGDSLDPDNT